MLKKILIEKQHRFARKILRRKTTDRLDWRLERTALRAISAQGHPNIIELLSVYECGDEYTFVFPYVEHNLHDVLHKDWTPERFAAASARTLDTHWLWNQTVQVASGLKTIHNPTKQYAGATNDSPVIGFHFDLKPANILVTSDGTLQITDFGQALIKFVGAEDATYGINRGGSPVYQAPEACPTRRSIESRKVDDRIYRRYDVWSLGCIMLEVMTFVFEGGSKGVKAFECERSEESNGEAFYKTTSIHPIEVRLKACALNRIDALKKKSPQSEPSSVYADRVITLVETMLRVDQQKRPSSDTVYANLERYGADSTRHAAETQQNTTLQAIPLSKGFVEAAWDDGSRLRSLIDL